MSPLISLCGSIYGHTYCLSVYASCSAVQTGSNRLLSLFMLRLYSREYQARHLDKHFILIILFSLLVNIENETFIIIIG